MGQKVETTLFLKEKQDRSKYNLIMFLLKLIGPEIYDGSRK